MPWGVFLERIPQPCSSCETPSIGVSGLDYSELFPQPRAQLQLSPSTLVGIRVALVVPPLVPHIIVTQASMGLEVLKFLQLGLRLR